MEKKIEIGIMGPVIFSFSVYNQSLFQSSHPHWWISGRASICQYRRPGLGRF